MEEKKKTAIRFMLLLVVGLFFTTPVSSQSITVNGLVKDISGEPIIGASVVLKGTASGTITDIDGKFQFQANEGDIVVISDIGYISQEVAAKPSLIITLEEDAESLEEVIVIGYGWAKKSDMTGSVTAIKTDEFSKGNQVSAQDALVGKIAGVNVVTSGGAPGSGATIRIRSGASLSASNDPLIVIDGVPVDNSDIEGASNIIGSINPADIESFTVLKDASATAIYGSRASNGVIVITTKKGTDEVRISYSGTYSVSTKTKTLDVLSADEFREFVPTVTGVPDDPDFGTADTDWQDEIYRTAFATDQNISVTGRIKPISSPYRVSVGYTNQSGIIDTNNYQRVSFSGNLSPSFFDDHLTFNLNLKVSYEKNQEVDESVVGNAITYDPTRPVKTGSSTASTDPGLGYFIWTNGGSPMAIQTDNPVAQLDLTDMYNKVIRSIGSATIQYKIHGFEDLKLNLNLGYDVLRSKYRCKVPELAGTMYTSNQKDGTGLRERSTQDKRNYLIDAYANYDKKLGKHTIGAMVGYGWQHFWKKYNLSTEDTYGNQLESDYHSESEYYLLSFYGRVNYSYDDRYLVTATLRSDASSRFSEDNRWGLFPSVALAWRVIDEDFLEDQNVLSDLKLRVGWGMTGQQDILNDYPYMTTFTISYDEASYRFGDTWYNTYRPNGYDNDIKWETTTTYNVGIDYGFLKSRIYGSIDYYKRYTRNLLNTINVLSGTNFSSVITTNIGKMENQGLEFSINAVPIRTKDMEWRLGFNFTWNDSEITKLNAIDTGSNYVETGSISDTGKYVQVFMVGERPYTFYLAKQAYDEDGNPMEGYYVQEDGSVSTTETRYATGKSALPSCYLGFNTHFSYKNFDFSLTGHGSFGNYVYNYVEANQYVQQVYSDQGSYSNILKSTRDLGFQSQQLYSDLWLENASFFRFDNITIGYTFDKLWKDGSTLRLTASVSNIATITGYDGIDPEISDGIDQTVYPRPRTYTIGVSLNF